jgi:hypothetical protein
MSTDTVTVTTLLLPLLLLLLLLLVPRVEPAVAAPARTLPKEDDPRLATNTALSAAPRNRESFHGRGDSP